MHKMSDCGYEDRKLFDCWTPAQHDPLRVKDCFVPTRSVPSSLRDVDLSGHIDFKDAGMKVLSVYLKGPDCELRTLRLAYCVLTKSSCASLCSVLDSNLSYLKELDLSGNLLQDEGVEQLCGGLKDTRCALETLRLAYCDLTKNSCASLYSVLESNPFHLKELDLSGNFLQDEGVEQLCGGLKNTHCTLETLRLAWCELTKSSCVSLRSVLRSNPSYLKELDLSGNFVLDVGVKKLCDGLKLTHCRVETLRLISCKLSGISCCWLAAALKLLCPLKDLDLSLNKLQNSGIRHLSDGLKSPHCRLKTLRLRDCHFSDCAALVSALKSNPSELRELDLCGNQLGKEEKKVLDELVKSHQGEPLRVNYGEHWSTTPWIGTNGKHTQPRVKTEEPAMSTEFLDEVFKPVEAKKCRVASLDESDWCEVPAEKTKGPSQFTPEVLHEIGEISYSFRIPSPGVFKCGLTGLMFTVTMEALLVYRILQWDEEVLLSAGKSPAGPLYDIQCEDMAVSQLHLPHGEQNSERPQGLSVVHFSDDGLSILQPLEVTDTHVVVDVHHLSPFGLVWNVVTRVLSIPRPGQILLFHRPAGEGLKQRLKVFLLPQNTPLELVKRHQEEAKYIEATSSCQLTEGQTYSVQCSETCKIQPEKAQFHSEYGPNYYPTFEIRFTPSIKEATVTVRDETQRNVWEYHVELTGFRENELKLFSARKEFINRMSGPGLKSLLDVLLEKKAVITSEMEDILAKKTRQDQARNLIDTVLGKGESACEILIKSLCTLDPCISETLRLTNKTKNEEIS